MKKAILLLSFFFLFPSIILASGFNVQTISGVSVGGKQISQWWNTSLTPVIVGEAPTGTNVVVNIDGSETTVVSDASGNWTHTPTLTAGDHQVTLTNSDSTLSFTLTVGTDNVNWDEAGKSVTDTLPTVGVILPTMLLFGTGSTALLLFKKLKT